MTIADKLAYLAATKSAIRQAIMDKGVPVAESVTFRELAAKIALIEGGGVVPVSAKAWRVRRISAPSSNFAGLMGLLFDGEFPTSGSPIFSSQFAASGDFSAGAAFQDNDLMWATLNGSAAGAYIGWEFPSTTQVLQITIRSANTVARAEYVPVEFAVEVSDDGTSWELVKVFSTTPWSQFQSRVFSL